MSQDSVFARWPHLEAEWNKVVSSDLRPYSVQLNFWDKSESWASDPQFEGIELIRFFFFEEKVYYLVVEYSNFEPGNLGNFISQAAKVLGLPKLGWKHLGRDRATLSCNGFQVEVQTGINGKRTDIPAIMMIDTVAQAKITRQEEQEKTPELLRKQQDRMNRRILKP